MGYDWREDLLPVGVDRPGQFIRPVGLVLHSTANPTANPGATARGHRTWLGRDKRGASAHVFVDWHEALRVIPDGLGPGWPEKAWHAGPYANLHDLGYALCETRDAAEFEASYPRFVWAAAQAIRHYGWEFDQVYSYRMISEQHPRATTHDDPDLYLNQWGLDFADLLADIRREVTRLLMPPPAVQVVDAAHTVHA